MMIKKEFRLTGKDINFLTKKKQYISAGCFLFFYFKQYENLKYNQISVHISLKISKKSVTRHMIKRAVIALVRLDNLINKPINNQFYKIFVILNKNNIDNLQKQIEKLSKNDIIQLIKKEFVNSWGSLNTKIK